VYLASPSETKKFICSIKFYIEMDKEELLMVTSITLDKEYDDWSKCIFTYSLENNEQGISFIYKHADTLIEIFSNYKLSNYKYKNLKRYLVRNYLGKDLFASKSGLSFFTLVKLGFIKEALISLEYRSLHGLESGSLFLLIDYILSSDEGYFTLKELFRISKALEKMYPGPNMYANEYKKNALTVIRNDSYNLAKKSIKGINLEINRDKEKVQEIIRYLDFDDKYNKLLSDIDKHINTDSQTLSAAMIGNLRSFMEDLVTDISKKISANESEEIPKYEGCGEMGCKRKYMKIKLELSDKDDNLISKFVDVLHSEGGHSFVSNKDYFRLARNIGIEIVLLILSKYENKYSK
jgi:hypothetical protein